MNSYIKEFHNSLSTSLFEDIRENILSGKYQAGEKITENRVCQEFGVSRTPVREAFKQLELEGLITNIPNRGAYVLGFSKRDIQDIYEIRKAVEIIAIKWAIERIDSDELSELQEAYDLMEFYTMKNEQGKMMETNTRFHEIIYKSTRSRFLEQILKSYQIYIYKTKKVALQSEAYLQDVLEEHKRILTSIYNKDFSEGEKAVFQHISNAQKRAENNLPLF